MHGCNNEYRMRVIEWISTYNGASLLLNTQWLFKIEQEMCHTIVSIVNNVFVVNSDSAVASKRDLTVVKKDRLVVHGAQR